MIVTNHTSALQTLYMTAYISLTASICAAQIVPQLPETYSTRNSLDSLFQSAPQSWGDPSWAWEEFHRQTNYRWLTAPKDADEFTEQEATYRLDSLRKMVSADQTLKYVMYEGTIGKDPNTPSIGKYDFDKGTFTLKFEPARFLLEVWDADSGEFTDGFVKALMGYGIGSSNKRQLSRDARNGLVVDYKGVCDSYPGQLSDEEGLSKLNFMGTKGSSESFLLPIKDLTRAEALSSRRDGADLRVQIVYQVTKITTRYTPLYTANAFQRLVEHEGDQNKAEIIWRQEFGSAHGLNRREFDLNVECTLKLVAFQITDAKDNELIAEWATDDSLRNQVTYDKAMVEKERYRAAIKKDPQVNLPDEMGLTQISKLVGLMTTPGGSANQDSRRGYFDRLEELYLKGADINEPFLMTEWIIAAVTEGIEAARS